MGYSYQVQDVIEAYKNKHGKFYMSYTMKDCCNNLKEELDILVAKGY